jgi:F-type H+-transporting ATPase subunit delta
MAGKKQEAVANVYAEALIELAYEKGTPAEILADLKQVGRALKADPRALTFLVAPHIKRDAKKQMIDHAFGGKVAEIVTNFMKVLVDKGRQGLLPVLVDRFEALYHDRQGETVVNIKAAVPLEDRERDRLKQSLKRRLKREIILEERVDPTLLGGLVIRVDDTVVDGSLRHRLATLAGRLEDSRLATTEVFE